MAKIKVEIDADLQDLIPQFTENRKKDILALEELIAKNDLPAIAALTHKIKGAASSYGFMQLSEIAAQMEKLSKNNEGTQLAALAQDMKNHFENIEIQFVPMS
ncbi:Hpt domain-containing protein [Bdellovibrio sp. KM01]|uniref:Hpt domain-containing protein n=1 Tax=Bdellovibrio sp. KM01 TaxID=2748865 RepID=UPI0015E9DF51|nr:Hpt domain-containing protein [Bdellovibrio sp. KM01]QLY25739.1 Hpt domain-containing protein [Bdellovibrio sp. KM01]